MQTNTAQNNPRRELVSLLRGRFATPVIAHLAERGALERMQQGAFSISDFADIANAQALTALFGYLSALGLIQELPESSGFSVTRQGERVFRRAGAFLIIDSYSDYFDRLPELLRDSEIAPSVNRRRNVLGSGALHRRKFFPAALEQMRGRSWDVVIDIGCGDGAFLECVRQEHSDTLFVAVDQSEVAVEETKRRLGPTSNLKTVVADGFEVDAWASAVPLGANVLVSLWFVTHEFSQGDPERVIAFFQRLAALLPQAEVLLGEIVAAPVATLAEQHSDSIMPEFLLFHALSGQGVLTWQQHQEVLEAIPYQLDRAPLRQSTASTEHRFDRAPLRQSTASTEHRFDEVLNGDGTKVPSSFLWHLSPTDRGGLP